MEGNGNPPFPLSFWHTKEYTMDQKKWNEENEKINKWMIEQGYDPDCVSSNDYVQKTDDCDWSV